MHSWPNYDSIVQSDYEMIDGYHSLGLIKKHRPDIELISLTGHTIQDQNFDWLKTKIDMVLGAGKKAAIISWDEDWMWPHNQTLFDLLNSYTNEPVWWITQVDHMEEWYEHRNLTIKCIEVQWWLLNDCLAYKELHNPNIVDAVNCSNYLCMLGRFEPHKYALGKKLYNAGLANYGMITVAYPKNYPDDHAGWSVTNPVDLYPKLNVQLGKTQANTLRGNTWASANVDNYLQLESAFANIPLILNPDSGFGIHFLNDKHLWPALLGKMFLVYGRPGIMKSMQRFWDVDMSRYANLEFDSILDNDQRLEAMIEMNQDLIKDCRDVWKLLQPELEQARWTVGKNFYTFVTRQLDLIQ